MKNNYSTTISTIFFSIEKSRLKLKFSILSFLFCSLNLVGFGQNLTQSGFTGVVVPQYMASGTASRLPVMFRATVSGLTANTSFRFYTQGATNSTVGGGTADFGLANSGAGNPLLINSTGTTFSYPSSPSLSTAGGYETFTTDATGSYTGWFGFVNTGNTRFTAGNTVYPTITLNAGGTGTTVSKRLALDLGITVLAFGGAGANNGSLLQSISTNATAKNLVAIYDNVNGTGRPLTVSVIESIGVTIASVPTAYSVSAGSWNTITPNTNGNGVRRIEQRSVTTNNIIGCALDTDGIWTTGSINTVNPTSGLTATIINTTDTPLNTCVIAPVITSSLTATGIVGTSISNYTISGSNSPTTFSASNLPAGLTFTSPTISGTPTNAGIFNATISVSNVAGSDSKTLVFTIDKGNQVITGLPTTDTKTYGDANYSLASSSSSGLAVSYSSSNTSVATISGNTVSIVGNGTTTITASQSGDANYNAATSINQTLTINPKTITVTSPTVPNKVYDRTNGATITGTLSGIVGTDVVTFSGTGTFTQATVGMGLAVTSTSTLIGTDASKYTLTQPTGLTGTIVVKPLTVSGAVASNKVYDGTSSAILIGATLNGILDPDVVTLTGGAIFSSVNVGNTIAINTSSLIISGADAGNYIALPIVGLTANITAKSLTISGLAANNKVFDGTTTAILSGTPFLNGIVGTDDVNLSGTAVATFAQATAGTGIAVAVTGYSLTGTSSGNYSVTQPTGLTADITAAPSPAISSGSTATATYGVASTSYFITATNSPTSFNAIGLPTGLTINTTTGEISGTPTDVAGSPFSVTISATNLGGTGTATLIYTITPKALTISTATVPNKVYDRTNVATITGTLLGVIGTDVVTLNGTGTFSQVNVGSGLVVTSISTLSGVDASKYTLTQPTGLTGEIVTKPLTVSGASVSNKVYDGNSTLTLVGATLNGIISPDVVTLAGGAVFSSVNVGNNIAINTSSLILTGADAGNYIALPIVGLTGNIISKALTITGLTINNKVFDGTTTATLSGTAVLNGIISGEESNVTLTGTPTATFNNRNIGVTKPITVSGYTLSGSQSTNYSVIQPTVLTGNITALTLTVNNPLAQNKVFDGNTNAAISGTLTGVISPDVVTFIGTGTFASSTVGNGIVVTSTSTLGGSGASNYTLTQPTGLSANITAPQFSTGNLVVVNVNSINAVSLIEYSNSGTFQQTFSIPSAGTDALTISYTAGSEGALSRSSSGYYLGLVGYRTGTNSSATDRVIARVNSTGTVNTKSVIPNSEGYTANNIRAAVFNDDGSRFWTSGTGTAAGVRTNVFEATSGSTQVSTTLTNTRVINIFNNQLYISSASGAFQGLSTVGTGLPTTTGNTITLLPGFPTTTGSGSYGFAINSTNTIAYVADDRATALGGIQKWTFNGGIWSLAYTLGTGVANNGARGLAVDWSGANPIIYATTAEASLNRIIKITDSGISSPVSTLATASANNIFRGLAFSPILAPTSVSLSVSSNTGTEAATTVITVTATASAPVIGNQTVTLGITGTNITAGDYTLSNSTITIPNGSTTGTVTFTIVDDIIAEATETAILTIGSPSPGIILGSPITQNITITDNDNTSPTIAIDVITTSNFVDGGIATSPLSSFAISGVLNDSTDPAKNFGIDFTIGDAETAVGSLIVTATSSNLTVLPIANLNLTGTGASRNLKITPHAEGLSDISITVNDGITISSFTINYASSNASINTSTTRFHTGTSDASTAQMIDNNLMFVGDDENQALRLYNRQNSGLPVASFDFTSTLGLTDLSGGLPREVDIEASAKVGNRIYWLGSHSNASSGNIRPNRYRFFATDIAGTGNATTLSYIGRYDNLKTDLLAWDASNGHGLGANFLGLTASSATGIAPEIANGSGFNIEGFEIAPNNSTAYICFRAPLENTTTRTKALIIPLTNFANLVSGNPTTATATFGKPIQLDLAGRAIREMKRNTSGEYLIIAGPHDGSTGIAPKDFRFYTWTGNPIDSPILMSANLTALISGGSFESIVDLPSPLLANSNLQVLVDNGDAIFYGNDVIAKDLPENNHKKFRSELINLGNSAIAIGTISGFTFCANASINIPFTTSETFNGGNVFTAQLSNASGSFVSPIVLGTLSGTNAGTILGTIPMSIITGTGYRIRVVSSNNPIIGADNGVNLTINNCTPLITIKSIKTGNWENVLTWDLGRIPQAGDLVIIDQNHEVTLNGSGTAKKVEYQGTGKLKLNSSTSTLSTGL